MRIRRQGRDNEPDFAFKATSAVMNAATAKAGVDSHGFDIFRFVFPIVAIDAPLFEAYLDVDENIQLEERDQMTLHWKNPGVGMADSVVFIVREREVENFVNSVRDAFQVFQNREDLLRQCLADHYQGP